MTPAEEARKRLIQAIPHIHIAANMATVQVPGSKSVLLVAAKFPDGSGRTTAEIGETLELLNDIALVLGFKDLNALMLADDEDDGAEP